MKEDIVYQLVEQLTGIRPPEESLALDKSLVDTRILIDGSEVLRLGNDEFDTDEDFYEIISEEFEERERELRNHVLEAIVSRVENDYSEFFDHFTGWAGEILDEKGLDDFISVEVAVEGQNMKHWESEDEFPKKPPVLMLTITNFDTIEIITELGTYPEIKLNEQLLKKAFLEMIKEK